MIIKFLKEYFRNTTDVNTFLKYFYKFKLTDSQPRGGVIKLKRLYYTYRMYKISRLYNCYIPNCCEIAERPIFPHELNGIFISGGAKIGKNCVIFQQVTIGSNTLEDSKNQGFPVIGDNVYIGAGAKIIGNVKVGNNVRIGANTTITKDIPDNATVVNGQIRIFESDIPKNNKFVGHSEYISKNKK